jgi:glycine/sarcosine N-methyltransferase
MPDSPREVPLYDQFGGRYDLMVDWAGRLARELPFLEGILRETEARRILDLGSATGHHAAHFAEIGVESVGADPSGELLRIARERFGDLPRLSFVQAGFGELAGTVEGIFDVVTCLGNTLPHVRDDANLRTALADVGSILRPGGRFVVQQLNYDRILANRQRFLGVGGRRDGERELLFFRFYDFPSGHGSPSGHDSPSGTHDTALTFNLVTFERGSEGGWSQRVDATTLLPITAAQLGSALAETGFDVDELYGDYAGQPFDPAASNDLILVARRRGLVASRPGAPASLGGESA